MKKILYFTLFLSLILVVTACGGPTEDGKTEHTHVYDQEVVSDANLASAATCKAKATYYKTCECGEKGTETFISGDLLAHAYNDGEITTAAGCESAGVKTFTCTVCGDTKTEEVASTGHSYASEWSSNDTHHWQDCPCGAKQGQAEHEFDNGMTVEGGRVYTCTICDAKYTNTTGVIKYEAEHLIPYTVQNNGGNFWCQDVWFGRSGQQLIWVDNHEGSTLDIQFNVPYAGTYTLFTRFCQAGDFAIFNVYVDGKLALENIDMFSPNLFASDRYSLGSHELTEGTHTLKIEIVGKNEASPAYVFGMDYLDLEYEADAEFVRYEMESDEINRQSHNAYCWTIYKDTIYSDKAVQLITDGNIGSYYTMDFVTSRDGNYTIKSAFIKSADFAIIRVYVDGVQLGDDLDLYSPNDIFGGRMTLGSLDLTAGTHTLKFEVVSKNAASVAYVVGVDYVDVIANEYYSEAPANPDDEGNKKTGTIRYEAENLIPYTTQENGGAFSHQNISFSRGGAQLLWVDNNVGSALNINFNVPYTGTYNIKTRFCNAADFAIFNLYVDGKLVLENVDMFSTVLGASQTYSLGSHELTEGTHTIRIEIVGKNEASVAYLFAMDFIDLSYVTEENSVRYEMESDDINRQSEGGKSWIRYRDSLASEQAAQLLSDCGVGAYYTMDITVDEDGSYTLKGAFVQAADFAVIKVYVDGVQVGGEIDLYSPVEITSARTLIGTLDLTAGTHTVKFEVAGKNEAAVGYLIGVDYVDVVKN